MKFKKFSRENKKQLNKHGNKATPPRMSRIQKEMQSDLSPKYTEIKSGARTSRSGRLLKNCEDANSVPTDLSKFVSKHSPKRLKPKESKLNDSQNEEDLKISPTLEVQNIPSEDKENFKEIETSDTVKLETEEPISIIKEEPKEEFDVAMEIENIEVKVEVDEIQIDEKIPQTSEKSVEVFDVPRKSPSEDRSSKQDFSDTDSALGNDGEFVAGQIVWGSFSRNSSWFPCMVYPTKDGSLFKDERQVKFIHVKYFNYNGCTAFLPVRNVFEFKDMDDFNEQIKAFKLLRKVKITSKVCLKAMEEAKFFRKYKLNDRMRVFDQVLKYQEEMKQQQRKSLDLKSPRSQKRNSVDSAVETGTAPSSPVPLADPVLDFMKTMERYDAFMPVDVKKEKKEIVTPPKILKKIATSQVTPPKVSVSIKTEEEEDADVKNRRKSGRAVKKRKYKDFIEDAEVLTENSSVKVESPSLEPKQKRQKIIKEESLEERFLVNQQDLKMMFYKVSKKRGCMECSELKEDNTHRCMGHNNSKCAGWFHESCAGSFEMKREEFRHQCGDSDEIFQTNQMIPYLVCKQCLKGVKNCFVCHQQLSEVDEAIQCPNQECRLSYHHECLKYWPQNKLSKNSSNKRNSLCPQHTCHTCFSKDIHNSGHLVKCLKCPAAYHLQLSCIPAGTKIISQTQVICPRHPTDKEKNRYVKEKGSKPLNIDWCSLCTESGSLICCESCPAAFHPQCINYVESNDNFHCVECQQGQLPLYNTIVWARVGAYRWWPGLIMPNHVVPESTLRSQKNNREFCVRFFGSYDFFWFTCDRVLGYESASFVVKKGNSRLDFAFKTAVTEADEMSKLLERENPKQISSKPKPYTKLLTNRPILPVKLKKIAEMGETEICACKPTDPNPCGRDSDCINMNLHFECNKLTCPAGNKCQNQKLSKREYADLQIIKTTHRGFGAVTTKDLPENTFVIEYVGDLINTNELNRRMKAKINNNEKDFYFLTIEGDLYVDAEPAGNMARFINHSCNPNCNTQKVTVDGNTRIGIFSNQFIPANTELTFDYQMEFVGNKKTPCFCGADKCSGLIGEKLKEEKKVQRKAARKKKKPIMRIKLEAPPKNSRRRTIEENRNPFEKMLAKMPENVCGVQMNPFVKIEPMDIEQKQAALEIQAMEEEPDPKSEVIEEKVA